MRSFSPRKPLFGKTLRIKNYHSLVTQIHELTVVSVSVEATNQSVALGG